MRHNKLCDEVHVQPMLLHINSFTYWYHCKVHEVELEIARRTYPVMCTDHVTLCPLFTAVTAAIASSSLFVASLCLISISIVIIRVYELMTDTAIATAVVTVSVIEL
jgi:hypothetical protein